MRRCLRDDTFSRFDRTSACDGQTDGQTDGHRAIAYTALAQCIKPFSAFWVTFLTNFFYYFFVILPTFL